MKWKRSERMQKLLGQCIEFMADLWDPQNNWFSQI